MASSRTATLATFGLTGALTAAATLGVTGLLTATSGVQITNGLISFTANPEMTYGTTTFGGYMEATCTATGGLAKYNTCTVSNPYTWTGSITRAEIQVSKAPISGATLVDCGVVDDTGTGTGETLFIDQSLTKTVHAVAPSTTEILIGPNQRVKCAGATGTGHSLSAKLKVWLHEVEL
jgi:hypothetical protein